MASASQILADTSGLISFRHQESFLASTEYQERRSNADPYQNTLPCIKAVCSNIRGDHQPKNRLADDAPDFSLQAYDPIQNVRRLNFLKRRPMLIVAQSADSRKTVNEVHGLADVIKSGPKLIRHNPPMFQPREIALLNIPIQIDGPLARRMPSLQDVQRRSATYEELVPLPVNSVIGVGGKRKEKRFQTRFQKVFIQDEYVKGVKENEGTKGAYTGYRPYQPRPITPKPSPYEPIVIDKHPVDNNKFRIEHLDYFRFPVDACPMRDFLNEGQTWLRTRVDEEVKWKVTDFLPKSRPKPFPPLEDVSFSRYPRPRTPYSRFLEKVATKLELPGDFDDDIAEENYSNQKNDERRQKERDKLKAPPITITSDDGKSVTTEATTSED